MGCPPQITGRIEHFIQRKAMDMDSLGEQTIHQLLCTGSGKESCRFIRFKSEEFGLEGYKDKSVKNLLDGSSDPRTIPFESVFFAIGIRYVGKTVAEKLARYFKSIDKIARASVEELLAAPEIGEKIAESIYEFFRIRKTNRRSSA